MGITAELVALIAGLLGAILGGGGLAAVLQARSQSRKAEADALKVIEELMTNALQRERERCDSLEGELSNLRIQYAIVQAKLDLLLTYLTMTPELSQDLEDAEERARDESRS